MKEQLISFWFKQNIKQVIGLLNVLDKHETSSLTQMKRQNIDNARLNWKPQKVLTELQMQ